MPRSLSINHGNKCEARALDFFQHIAGPAVSGQFDVDFWTYLIPQLSHCKSPIRHALVAISTLYEQFQDTSRLHVPLRKNSLAIRSYNSAIRELVIASDEPLALVMSVLFTCIEFLQGDTQSAIDHCRHGVLMFNTTGTSSAWAHDYLVPMISSLSIFPFFFGGNISTFPRLAGLPIHIAPYFYNLKDVQSSLDMILSQWIRFVRSGDTYRLGPLRNAPISTKLRLEQDNIIKSLNDWHLAFSDFKISNPRLFDGALGPCILEIKYLVGKIWASTALERSETAYDMHMSSFQSILDLASRTTTSLTPNQHSRRQFSFATGFLPLLYFVVIKCRSLKIRINALSCMKSLAFNQESLWSLDLMYRMGRRMIEMEHTVTLDEVGKPYSLDYISDMPPEDKRVQECIMADPEIRCDTNGCMIHQREVSYFFLKPGGELEIRHEWMDVS
jgi:hypothetical protein